MLDENSVLKSEQKMMVWLGRSPISQRPEVVCSRGWGVSATFPVVTLKTGGWGTAHEIFHLKSRPAAKLPL